MNTDPRYTTLYTRDWIPPRASDNAGCEYFNVILPRSAVMDDNGCCVPGYNPKRPNKGYMLRVNDFPYHSVRLNGDGWDKYVIRTN